MNDHINIHLPEGVPGEPGGEPYPAEEIFGAVHAHLRPFIFENISNELFDRVHDAIERAIDTMLPKLGERYDVYFALYPDRNRIDLIFSERSAVDQLADLSDG